ncbi:hypothetical protein PsorP6_016534 [Peronosclerospora sorghi]|uniref:Uncharacterized protein n=1 Tax=Peronosclerospora sorghi TaxID=230839 RepID=A0ACC0VMW3_9STRA|nr:hypothetical protein PsorP6_016534 [Peronosclerospora sorghi]
MSVNSLPSLSSLAEPNASAALVLNSSSFVDSNVGALKHRGIPVPDNSLLSVSHPSSIRPPDRSTPSPDSLDPDRRFSSGGNAKEAGGLRKKKIALLTDVLPNGMQYSQQVPEERSPFLGEKTPLALEDLVSNATGNYDRWRGDTQKGISKETLAGEIVDLLKKEGITHLDNKVPNCLTCRGEGEVTRIARELRKSVGLEESNGLWVVGQGSQRWNEHSPRLDLFSFESTAKL